MKEIDPGPLLPVVYVLLFMEDIFMTVYHML